MKKQFKKLALLGQGIEYSLSPKIHALIMRHLAMEGSYELLDTDSLERMDICAYDGINVTKPYKCRVLQFIDQNCSKIPAINTIVNSNGRLLGYNTDIDGFLFALNYHQIPTQNALILGAGGASQSAIAVLDSPQIWAREQAKAQALAKTLGATVFSEEFCPSLIVNCTSEPNLALPSGISTKRLKYAFDFNYARGRGFLDQFEDSVKTVDGRLMLIAQAVYAQQLFFDLKLTNWQINDIIDVVGREL